MCFRRDVLLERLWKDVPPGFAAALAKARNPLSAGAYVQPEQLPSRQVVSRMRAGRRGRPLRRPSAPGW